MGIVERFYFEGIKQGRALSSDITVMATLISIVGEEHIFAVKGNRDFGSR
jgi:hypothetical protein